VPRAGTRVRVPDSEFLVESKAGHTQLVSGHDLGQVASSFGKAIAQSGVRLVDADARRERACMPAGLHDQIGRCSAGSASMIALRMVAM
jgi:hypothetical protein